MDEDTIILLKENARLLEELSKAGRSVTDDISIIPIILKYGSFSPKRLESWDFEAIEKLAQSDKTFLSSLISSFVSLATKALNDPYVPVSIHEKKAVSFLLAARSRAPQLVDIILKEAALSAPRLYLLSREYLLSENEWLQHDFIINLPVSNFNIICPKFVAKYPLSALFISNPSFHPVLELMNDSNRLDELTFVVNLAASHFDNDSQALYDNILLPAWQSKDLHVAKAVLQALSVNPDLREFCLDKLK